MPITTPFKSGGDRIRTCDLEVMSLASYLAAPPRVIFYGARRTSQPGLLLLHQGQPVGKVRFVCRCADLDADQVKREWSVGALLAAGVSRR